MRSLNLGIFALCTIWWTGLSINAQLLAIDPHSYPCIEGSCESSDLSCGSDGINPVCNPTTNQCYCLQYLCNNRENNCSSTVCGVLERAECILNKYGTSCKCIPRITALHCNTANTTCSLRNINEANLQRYNEICRNLGQDYFAETCRRNGECRCVSIVPNCSLTGCEASVLRCGPERTVPSCNPTTRQCYCLNYQCDNLHNTCNSTACGIGEHPECVLDRYGTNCKCFRTEEEECRFIFRPTCRLAGVNQAEIQRYDNICAQRGGTFFANNLICRTHVENPEECRCVDVVRGCRGEADCGCPSGSNGYCVFNSCAAECTCTSSEVCTRGCAAGQKSTCTMSGTCTLCAKICSSDSDCREVACPADKPFRRCGFNGCYCDIHRCTSRSQCPDCGDNLKKSCRDDGTCACISQQSCIRNEDCTRENGFDCNFFNFNPSCCWKGRTDVACRCRAGGLFGCSKGESGTEQVIFD